MACFVLAARAGCHGDQQDPEDKDFPDTKLGPHTFYQDDGFELLARKFTSEEACILSLGLKKDKTPSIGATIEDRPGSEGSSPEAVSKASYSRTTSYLAGCLRPSCCRLRTHCLLIQGKTEGEEGSTVMKWLDGLQRGERLEEVLVGGPSSPLGTTTSGNSDTDTTAQPTVIPVSAARVAEELEAPPTLPSL